MTWLILVLSAIVVALWIETHRHIKAMREGRIPRGNGWRPRDDEPRNQRK